MRLQARRKSVKSINARKHGWPEQSVAVESLRQTLSDLDWSKVFKLSFMYLFFCYPGITLKLLRVFKCQTVEGVQYLSADLRLQCYTAQWAGFAAYAGVMLAVYTVGLPVGVFLALWYRRTKLYGANSEPTLSVRVCPGASCTSHMARARGSGRSLKCCANCF